MKVGQMSEVNSCVEQTWIVNDNYKKLLSLAEPGVGQEGCGSE